MNDTNPKEEIPLSHLLDYCTNPSSPHWNYGWNVFIRRYKSTITGIIINRCHSWRLETLKKQFPEIVNDILSRIFILLIQNDYALLKRFQARDNHYQFVAYLVTICDRITRSYILEFFRDSFPDRQKQLARLYLQEIEGDQGWELYEQLVGALRGAAGIRKKNNERDIHLFMMYIWGDFSTKSVQQHKFYSGMGERVLDLVISRMRQVLKNCKFLPLS
ncbi:MAG TPA: hypothetical protein PLP19_18535 [bacterium]|nr:hypothetical protein [bacterium]HPN45496.1 hypothetical protein [bacterium]